MSSSAMKDRGKLGCKGGDNQFWKREKGILEGGGRWLTEDMTIRPTLRPVCQVAGQCMGVRGGCGS